MSDSTIYIHNAEGALVATVDSDRRIMDTGGTVRGSIADGLVMDTGGTVRGSIADGLVMDTGGTVRGSIADGLVMDAGGVEVARLEAYETTPMMQEAGGAFLLIDELQVPRQEMTRPFDDIDTNRQIGWSRETGRGRGLSM
jgi:hypothetical protein